MKNLLILYNVVFFFVGNILLSNIHHLSHHDHNHDLVENQECYECINFDNSKDCITYNNEINFLNTFEISKVEYSNTVVFFTYKEYKSRAPPIS